MELSSPIIFHLLHFLLLISLVCPIYCSKTNSHHFVNQTFQQEKKFHKLKKKIAIHLQRINKPAVKTIHSPDGDIIDCVLFHNQPAFDHPLLKGHKPASPPKLPKGYIEDNSSDILQLWSLSGESCPEGTIPIRRTREEDILRAGSINKFEKKLSDFRNYTNRATTVEYAVQTMTDEIYGAKATINVWAPYVDDRNEFSASKVWISSGPPDNSNRNSIEVGWQVSPSLYGDHRPRFTIYWTADGYVNTGCYNLLCSGFIQTNRQIALGSAISPLSTYNGTQYAITVMVWKDSLDKNWWFKWGSQGLLLGYWPSTLFTYLKYYANDVQFGGAIKNLRRRGFHTFTQMGSGHFAEEDFGKAAHFKNIQLVTADEILVPLGDHATALSFQDCYNLIEGVHQDWGNYFFFGGPGKNLECS